MSRGRWRTPKWWEEAGLRSPVLPPPHWETLGQSHPSFPAHQTSGTRTASRGSRGFWAQDCAAGLGAAARGADRGSGPWYRRQVLEDTVPVLQRPGCLRPGPGPAEPASPHPPTPGAELCGRQQERPRPHGARGQLPDQGMRSRRDTKPEAPWATQDWRVVLGRGFARLEKTEAGKGFCRPACLRL